MAIEDNKLHYFLPFYHSEPENGFRATNGKYNIGMISIDNGFFPEKIYCVTWQWFISKMHVEFSHGVTKAVKYTFTSPRYHIDITNLLRGRGIIWTSRYHP